MSQKLTYLGDILESHPEFIPDFDKNFLTRDFLRTKRFSPVVYDPSQKMPERDHPEYEAWWQEQYRRCIMGYVVPNATRRGHSVWIPGRLYFYLNFWIIFAMLDNGERKDKRNPKNYYIINNDGIVEEYVLNSEDSNKKKNLIEEAIKDKEVLSKIYDELLDTTAYDEVGMNDEFQLSRDSFMNLSSIEDMKSKIEEILGATYTDGLQLEGKYIDNIIDYENCSINLV